MNKDNIFITFFSLLGLVSIFITAIKIGSPNDLNLYRKDEVVVNDIIRMHAAVFSYIRTKNDLPLSSADILSDPNAEYMSKTIKSKIDYNKESDNNFSLCASFETDVNDEKYKKFVTNNFSTGIGEDEKAQVYKHGKGYVCFDFSNTLSTGKTSNRLHPSQEYEFRQIPNDPIDDTKGTLLEMNKIQNTSTSPASAY